MADLVRYGKNTQSTVFKEDNSLIGILNSFKMPKIEWQTVDLGTLGQQVIFKSPTRVMNALEVSATWGMFEPEMTEDLFNPTKAHTFQMHRPFDVSGPDGFDAEKSFTLITLVTVQFYAFDDPTAKLGEEYEGEMEGTCSRMVHRIHDQDDVMFEADVFANTVRNSSGAFWK